MFNVYSPNSNFVVKANGCDIKEALLSCRVQLGAVNETGMVELDHEEEAIVVDVIVCVWVAGLDVLDVCVA